MDSDLAVLVWGVRLMLVVVVLAVVAVFWLVWRVSVIPVVTEARRARAAGDWWLPWLRRPDGGWGPLTANRWWAGFRAEERGDSGGLAVRWGFWTGQAVVIALGSVAAVGGLVAMVVAFWV